MARNLDPQILMEYERVLNQLTLRAGENKIDPTLDRIAFLADILGQPQLSYDVIHIAGTNGKTSTSRMVESLLSATSLNVGLTTSPHLHDVRERIRIYGQPIELELFIETFDDVAPLVALTEEKFGTPISFFETMTALAFAAFAQAPVDIAVVEVGMGGRWDATNIVQPTVCVITPIGLDHQEYLGDTIAKIAAEKAGIIKPNSVVVVGEQHPEALEVIQRQAQEVGAALLLQGIDFDVVDRQVAVGGQVLQLRGLAGVYTDVVMPLFGAHQAKNASLALAAVEAFFGAGIEGREIDSEMVHQGFGRVTSPGRLEVVRRGPTVLVDAAHNPHGATALATSLESEFTFDVLVGVVGMFADKDSEGFLGVMEPTFDRLLITQTDHERALAAGELAEIAIKIYGDDRVEVLPRLTDAIARGIEIADAVLAEDDKNVGIVVCGSVYTAAQARALLGKRDV